MLFISSLCSALVYYHLIHKVYSVALYLKEFCGYISILSNSNSLHVPEWPCCCSTYHVLFPSLIFRTSTAQLRIHMCIFWCALMFKCHLTEDQASANICLLVQSGRYGISSTGLQINFASCRLSGPLHFLACPISFMPWCEMLLWAKEQLTLPVLCVTRGLALKRCACALFVQRVPRSKLKHHSLSVSPVSGSVLGGFNKLPSRYQQALD